MNHIPDGFLHNKYLEFINSSPAHVNFNYHTELTALKFKARSLLFCYTDECLLSLKNSSRISFTIYTEARGCLGEYEFIPVKRRLFLASVRCDHTGVAWVWLNVGLLSESKLWLTRESHQVREQWDLQRFDGRGGGRTRIQQCNLN